MSVFYRLYARNGYCCSGRQFKTPTKTNLDFGTWFNTLALKVYYHIMTSSNLERKMATGCHGDHNAACVSDTISSAGEGTVVDGVNLDEIREFAKTFKIRRLSLGLTQTQVGQALSATEGPSYSQSAICR